MAKLKVLITHAVPVNNGDTALVLGLYQKLVNAGYEVTIATFYYDTVKDKYPELPFIKELGDYYLLKKLPFLKTSFIRFSFALNRQYNSHDIYIAAPGGYVNSYYYLSHALAPLIQAHRHGKKTAIYSQSIGPLSKYDQARFVKASSDIDLVMVRDVFSEEVMKTLSYPSAYFKTKDAAFLMPIQEHSNISQKRAAVSVRQWGHDNRDMAAYLSLMAQMCNYLIQDGYDVVFLSTCQGVPNYKDDSETALEVQTILANEYGLTEHIEVDRNYYTLKSLMDRMHDFDLVLGTRLHMCILSWINQVPALNISYEVKGRECYEYLGIPEYSIDFNQDAATSIETLEAFVGNLDEIKTTTLRTIEKIHNEVTEDFKKFQKLLLEES